jgi:O-antigen/teichoic acid export membrane protein
VLIPKLSYLFKQNKKEYKVLLQKSINYIYLVAFPATTGILMLSKEITFLFGGNEFLPAAQSVALTSSLVILVSIGTWQYNQIFLPTSNEKIGLKIQIIIAIISVLLNLTLIPKFSYIGTCISIIVAETIGTMFGAYYIRRKEESIRIQYFTKSFFIYLSSSIIMGLFIMTIRLITHGYHQSLIISILFSPFVYGIITIILKDKIVIETLRSLLKRLQKK